MSASIQLAVIESSGGILSSALLGVFPLLARWVLTWLEARRLLAPWPKPRRFDCNLVVIGGGSAGLGRQVEPGAGTDDVENFSTNEARAARNITPTQSLCDHFADVYPC